MKEAQDVDRAQETVAAVNQQLDELDTKFKEETDATERSLDLQTESLETISIKPTKANVAVRFLSLVWTPFWHDAQGQANPAWQ
jgi:hypothetical protein